MTTFKKLYSLFRHFIKDLPHFKHSYDSLLIKVVAKRTAGQYLLLHRKKSSDKSIFA